MGKAGALEGRMLMDRAQSDRGSVSSRLARSQWAVFAKGNVASIVPPALI
jgi:hypothetical protein